MGEYMRLLSIMFLVCITILGQDNLVHAQQPSPLESGEMSYIVPYFEPPRNMDLCGEPVPLYRPDVLERFDREFTIVVYSHAQVYLWLKRIERYLPFIEERIRRQGLPEDLKYVAIAESDLLHDARSPAGAAGTWQFIKTTGERYGLRVDRLIDERYDYEKATERALSYLKNLYSRFNNWALALASYNCGEERVEVSMREQGVRSYYDLLLPKETERYVFRILAIKEVLSHPEKYGYALPKGQEYVRPSFDEVPARIQYSLPLVKVAKAANMNPREFVNLNPSFRGDYIPSGFYTFRVPSGMAAQFKTTLARIDTLYQPRFVYHVVRNGETLSSIARKYNISVGELKKWNALEGNIIKIGQQLKIEKVGGN